MITTESLQPQLDRVQRIALVTGVTGLVVCAVGAFFNPEQFFQSYLFAYLFWLGLALGCLAGVMLYHLVDGAWGFVIRRLLETGAMLLPLLALLFVPLVFGLSELYPWARPEEVAEDAVLQHRSAVMNVPFFLLRVVLYFAIWIGMAFLLNRWSLEQDRTGDPVLTVRMRMLSGPGLVLYVLTMSFAAWDWGMSLEHHWYSTIYGVLFVTRQALGALALAIVLVALLSRREPLAGVITTRHFHDLGNLLLAFVILWAYMNLSQFLIIWSGNIPEEVTWYIARTEGGWGWVARFLIVFEFILPFLVLLWRRSKRTVSILSLLAAGIVLLYLVDLFWVIVPSFHEGEFRVHWLDFLTPIGIGGLWVAAFAWGLKRKPLVPLHDPRHPHLQEALEHG